MRLRSLKNVFMSAATIAIAIVGLLLAGSQMASAAPNLEINYQGKLTDTTGAAVTDGSYNIRFWLYDDISAATTSAIWTEEWLVGSSNGIQLTSGLFSTMLGSTTAFTGVDFNQTLYLGVEIGGTGGTPTWDGEMSPRKVLGTVPAAFEAQQLDGLATTSFLRADEADTMEATSDATLLTLIQNGTGAIFDAVNSSAESVFKVFDSGVVTIGTSTADSIATSTGLAIYNKDLDILIGTGTPMWGVGSIGDGESGATVLNNTSDVKVVGDYMYATANGTDDGVQIIDISDPTNPTGIGSVTDGNNGANTLDFPNEIEVAGNYAFVASNADDGIQVLDISNPTNIRGVGSITDENNGADTLNDPFDIKVAGNYAYVTAIADGGLQILDISDPTNPTGVGSITDTGSTLLSSPRKVTLHGNYAFVASTGEDGIQIIDISDPTNPIALDSVGGIGAAYDVYVNGSYAYITGTDGLLAVVDVTDPSNISLVVTINDGTNGANTLASAREIAVAGEYMFVAARNDDGVQVFDISSSSNPVAVGHVLDDENGTNRLTGSQEIYAVGEYLYVAGITDNGVQILSLPSLVTPTSNIGNLVSNDIESDYLRVTQALVTDGSLNVGTNALISGALTITGTASSSLQSANTNAALVVTSGYVGIGTTSPYTDLSIDGDIALTGGIYDSSSSRGTSGMVLQTDGTNVTWVATSSLGIDVTETSLFTDGGDITYLTSLTDVLSIGTTTDVATSTGLAVYNRDVEVLVGDIATVGSIVDGASGATELNGAKDIVVNGSYVYVASEVDDGFQILDISDPTNPVGLGEVTDSVSTVLVDATGVAVSGNYAYVVSNGEDGVQILDISNPTNPIAVGSITDGNNGASVLTNASAIAVSGKYAYVTSGFENGLQILDISDPANPVGVGSILDSTNGADALEGAKKVVVRGSYAYVIGEVDDGLQILDISDPTNPVGVGSVSDGASGADLLDRPQDITLSGNYAYITSRNDSALEIIDISDPTSPVGVGSIADGSNGADGLAGASGVAVAGNYAFVTSLTDEAVQVVDVSSSTNPVGVSSVFDADSGANILLNPRSVKVLGNYLYVVSEEDDGLQILSLPGLITPTAEIGNLVSNEIDTDYLRVTQALVADSGLNVGTNALVGGSLTIGGTASSSLQEQSTDASLAIQYGALGIGTSSISSTSVGVSIYNSDVEILVGTGTSLWGVGSIADGASGADELNGAIAIEVVGDLGYVAGFDDNGFQILDISDPTAPVGLGEIADSGSTALEQAVDVAVQGDYAYVASFGEDALQIIDISNPSSPTALGSISSSSGALLETAHSVAVQGQYAYVVSRTDDALVVIDVSDPNNPISVGSISDGNNGATELNGAYDIKVRGNYAYVASVVDNGFQIIDISDPTNPTGLGEISDDATTALAGAVHVALDGRYAYVTGFNDDGVQSIDISDPNNPTAVASTTDGNNGAVELSQANGIEVIGSYALVASRADNGVQILDISDPANMVGVGSIGEGENGTDELSGANDLEISGGYVYVAGYSDDGVQILSLPSLVTPTANIGNLVSNNIETEYLQISEALTTDGSLNIGTNALIGGALTITGTASSTLLGSNSNPALTLTSGYFGIGTTSSFVEMGVSGDVALTGGIYDSTASLGNSGDILQSTGSGLQWVATSTLGITSTGGDLFTDGGDITYLTSLTDVLSIGTTTDVATSTGLAVYNRDVEIFVGTPTEIGNVDVGQDVKDLVIRGDYAYLATQDTNHFKIYDVSDPTNPSFLSEIATADELEKVRVVGNYAYVISKVIGDDLEIIDISNPAAPVIIGGVNGNSSEVRSLDVAGNYAYVGTVADAAEEFMVFDVSDPTNPILVGGYETPAGARSISVVGDKAYVGSQTAGDDFLVLDIADPTNVSLLGSIELGSSLIRGIDVDGQYAHIAGSDDSTNYMIIDVSDPSSLSVVGSAALSSDGYSVQVVGNYAYVSAESTGADEIYIFDISDVTSPALVSSFDAAARANQVYVQGGYLYVGTDTSGDDLEIFKLPTLTTPTANIGNLVSNDIETDYLRVTQSLVADSSLNVGTNAMIGGSLTVVGTASSSLQGESTDATLAITSGALGVGTSTNIATSTGVAVFNKDIGITAASLEKVGGVDLGFSGLFRGLDVVGDLAYGCGVVNSADNLVILDVSDPTNPTQLGGVENGSGENCRDVEVDGNYAYAIDATNGSGSGYFTVFDVSNPTAPTQISTTTLDDSVLDLEVRGNYAYTVGWNGGTNDLTAIDISDPLNPTIVGGFNLGANAFGLTVRGNFMFVGGSNEFNVYDISDPTSIIEVSSLSTSGNSHDSVELVGNYAYTSCDDGICIIDISDVNNTSLVATTSAQSGVDAIQSVGKYLVTTGSDASEDIMLFDISSSTSPIKLDGDGFSGDMLAVDVVGQYVYAAGDFNGDYLHVYRLQTLVTPTANIGNLVSNDIETDYARVTQALTTDGSLNVGTNALIGGTLTITGTASSSLQSGNTNPALTVTSGYVGIGTTSPYADLSVSGDIALTGGIYDTNAALGSSQDLLQSTGSAVEWVTAASLGISTVASFFTDGGDITYLTSLTDVLSIGTSTDIATSTGLAVYNRDIEIAAEAPEFLDEAQLGSNGNGIAVSNGLAYVASDGSGGDLEIFDFSDPNNLVEIGSHDAGSKNYNDVEVVGNYAYTIAGTVGDEFEVFDISDPTSPDKVGGTDTIAVSREIEIQGKYAYVVSEVATGGFEVFDISDPTNPFKVGGADIADLGNDLVVSGNYAHVVTDATAGDDLEIFDISDPTNPTKVGGVVADDEANTIDIQGHYVYLGLDNTGEDVQVFDVSDPANPTEVGSGINGFGIVNAVLVVGDYLYAGVNGGTVYVIDISDPAALSLITSFSYGTNVLDMAVYGEYLLITEGGSGDDYVGIFKLPTLTTPTANIGNLVSDDIETSFLSVTQALKADSLNVNTNGMIGGSLTITGTASSSLIASNSNTALTITSGFVEIGTSTNATSGIQIGYGGICVDNDGECTASTTGRISSVDTYSGNSDLAETYFSADDLEAGDIVELEANLSVNRANGDNTIIGVVSTKPGVLLGFDDASLAEGEQSYPIALKGRVPVKVTTENGPINPGDQLMLSSIPGTAMKATGTGAVVGIALEAFDPEENDQYFSDTFINQFTDDLPSTEDVEAVIEELTASSTETLELDNSEDVQKGQIVMFVDLSYRYVDDITNESLGVLMREGTEGSDEPLFNRIFSLARGFVNGALSIFAIDAKRVEVVDELCINGTCIQSDDLRVLIDSLDEGVTQVTVINDGGDGTEEVAAEVLDEPSETSSTTISTSNPGENTTPTTTDISDNIDTASTTTAGGDLGNEETASSTDNTAIEPQNTDTDVQRENVEETTVEDEEPASVETPVSTEQETDETPEEDTPPEEIVVEEEVVETPPESTSEDVNQETS